MDELQAVVDPNDRAYVEQIEDEALRAVVVSSLRRHRVGETLAAGDLAPSGRLFAADTGEPVELDSLLGRRPVLLVFGSFT